MSASLFLLTLLSPLGMAVVHAVVIRILGAHRVAPQKLTAFCALGTAIAVAGFVFSRAGSSASLFSLVLGLLFAHVYFHIFNMSETARRIHILVGLRLGDSLSHRGESYSPAQLTGIRLNRLRQLGVIRPVNGKFVALPSILGKVAMGMKRYERLLFPQRFREEKKVRPFPKASGG